MIKQLKFDLPLPVFHIRDKCIKIVCSREGMVYICVTFNKFLFDLSVLSKLWFDMSFELVQQLHPTVINFEFKGVNKNEINQSNKKHFVKGSLGRSKDKRCV